MSNFPHGQSAPEKFKSIGLTKTVGFGYHTYNSALEMSKLAIFFLFCNFIDSEANGYHICNKLWDVSILNNIS